MKTIRTAFIIFALLCTLLALPVSETYAQFSGKVLFVTVTATARDSMVRQRFVDWGLTYDLMDIATFKAAVPHDTVLAKYKFVYISEACKSADLNNARGLNAPIFTHKSYMAPKAVAGWCAGAAQNVLTTGTVEILDGTHPLAGSYATGDTVQLVTGTSATKYINYFPKDPLVPMLNIAKVRGDASNTQLVVVGIEKGTPVYATASEPTPSLPLKARVAIVGINSEANAYMTEGSWKLAKAGVQWVLENPTSANEDASRINGFELEQNYPNPFNPATTIQYSVGSPQPTVVSLKIFDALGREAAMLVNEEKTSGRYTVSFNASSLPSGTYFYELRAGDYREVKKMVVLK